MIIKLIRKLLQILVVPYIAGCTFSQLSNLKDVMEWDIDMGRTIYSAGINRTYYGFSREPSLLEDGKKKWTFSNDDGCEVVYITYTDKDGDDIVLEAYFLSEEFKCDKRIRYSSDFL
jgi:hypothetical protein